MWFFDMIGWVWWLVNWPTNYVLGDNLFDLLLEAVFVAGYIMVCAIPIWIIVAILRRVWRALGTGRKVLHITFSGDVLNFVTWIRRASSYKLAFVLTAIMIVPPHVYMSICLREHKTEFKYRAMGSHSEDFSGVEPGEPGRYDYGGKLDEMVIARTQVLARRQFVPYFTAYWHTDGFGGTVVPGAYIYTYLPKSAYDDAFASVAVWLSGEDKTVFLDEFQMFLKENVWTPPTRMTAADEKFVILALAALVFVLSVALLTTKRPGAALVWYGFFLSLLALGGMSIAW